MANVRIGQDGSIIKNGAVVENDGRTIIREDGTIETTNTSGNIPPAGFVAMPPVSPLEQDRNSNNNRSTGPSPSLHAGSGVNLEAIREKEFDIQMQEARIRNSIPKGMIIATVILCVLGLIGLYILFIPTVITGTLIIVKFKKKSKLESELKRMYEELEALKRGERL